jgi:membrane protein DedA with SNARE-associated domain
VQTIREFKKEFAMKRFLAGLLALPMAALAQTAGQAAPEPPVEAHPIGTIVFVVLFVGFCVVFVWMVWRNKGKKEDQKPES